MLSASGVTESSIDVAALALIRALDAITRGPFAMLICHHGSNYLGTGNYSWLQSAYGWLPRRYKKNMKRLWILRPTFALRAVFAVVSPFISSKFWKKLQYLHSCDEAASIATPEGLVLPRDVLEASTGSPAAAGSLEHAMTDSAVSGISKDPRSGNGLPMGSDDQRTPIALFCSPSLSPWRVG